MIDDLIRDARIYPVENLLDSMGCKKGRDGGRKVFYSSPFSSDSSPSFCVYLNSNSWFDFSNGDGGDVIQLYMKLKNCSFMTAIKELAGEVGLDDIEQHIKSKKDEVEEVKFNIGDYITNNEADQILINAYAMSRGIEYGYWPANVPDYSTGERVNRLAMMFEHQNSSGKITGAKFRFINPAYHGSRFTARGKLGFYILKNTLPKYNDDTVVYFVESETSANSLWRICDDCDINAVVISFGAVSSHVREVPEAYSHIKKRYVIIDYDGDEDLYQERIKIHEHLGKPIKLELPKGEDINSLYVKGERKLLFDLISEERKISEDGKTNS